MVAATDPFVTGLEQARVPAHRLTPEQRRVHDMVVAGPRGVVIGPLRAAIHNPELAERWYPQMLNVPRPRLIALIRLGEKIVSLLPVGKSK